MGGALSIEAISDISSNAWSDLTSAGHGSVTQVVQDSLSPGFSLQRALGKYRLLQVFRVSSPPRPGASTPIAPSMGDITLKLFIIPSKAATVIGGGGLQSDSESLEGQAGHSTSEQALPSARQTEGLMASLRNIELAVADMKDQIVPQVHPNLLSTDTMQVTERLVFVTRQHICKSLYDRIHDRPPLTTVEQKWLMLQMIASVAQLHSTGFMHSDLKTENFFVLDGLRVFLADMMAAAYKPLYISEGTAGKAFTLFFETDSKRRRCYLAPERVVSILDKERRDAKGSKTGEAPCLSSGGYDRAQQKMDVFSLGCCLAELFLGGMFQFDLEHLMDFRKALNYGCAYTLYMCINRNGQTAKHSPSHLVTSKVEDHAVRRMILSMLARSPDDRHLPTSYLSQGIANGLFPRSFTHALFPLYAVCSGCPMFESAGLRLELLAENFSFLALSLLGPATISRAFKLEFPKNRDFIACWRDYVANCLPPPDDLMVLQCVEESRGPFGFGTVGKCAYPMQWLAACSDLAESSSASHAKNESRTARKFELPPLPRLSSSKCAQFTSDMIKLWAKGAEVHSVDVPTPESPENWRQYAFGQRAAEIHRALFEPDLNDLDPRPNSKSQATDGGSLPVSDRQEPSEEQYASQQQQHDSGDPVAFGIFADMLCGCGPGLSNYRSGQRWLALVRLCAALCTATFLRDQLIPLLLATSRSSRLGLLSPDIVRTLSHILPLLTQWKGASEYYVDFLLPFLDDSIGSLHQPRQSRTQIHPPLVAAVAEECHTWLRLALDACGREKRPDLVPRARQLFEHIVTTLQTMAFSDFSALKRESLVVVQAQHIFLRNMWNWTDSLGPEAIQRTVLPSIMQLLSSPHWEIRDAFCRSLSTALSLSHSPEAIQEECLSTPVAFSSPLSPLGRVAIEGVLWPCLEQVVSSDCNERPLESALELLSLCIFPHRLFGHQALIAIARKCCPLLMHPSDNVCRLAAKVVLRVGNALGGDVAWVAHVAPVLSMLGPSVSSSLLLPPPSEETFFFILALCRCSEEAWRSGDSQTLPPLLKPYCQAVRHSASMSTLNAESPAAPLASTDTNPSQDMLPAATSRPFMTAYKNIDICQGPQQLSPNPQVQGPVSQQFLADTDSYLWRGEDLARKGDGGEEEGFVASISAVASATGVSDASSLMASACMICSDEDFNDKQRVRRVALASPDSKLALSQALQGCADYAAQWRPLPSELGLLVDGVGTKCSLYWPKTPAPSLTAEVLLGNNEFRPPPRRGTPSPAFFLSADSLRTQIQRNWLASKAGVVFASNIDSPGPVFTLAASQGGTMAFQGTEKKANQWGSGGTTRASESCWRPNGLLLGTLYHSLHVGAKGVAALDTADDGRLVVSGGGDGSVRVWKTMSLDSDAAPQPHRILGVSDFRRKFDISVLRGSHSTALGQSGGVEVYRLETGQCLSKVSFYSAQCDAGDTLKIRPFDNAQDSCLLSLLEDGCVRAWDLRVPWSGQVEERAGLFRLEVSPFMGIPTGMAVLPDTYSVYVSTVGGYLEGFDLRFLRGVPAFSRKAPGPIAFVESAGIGSLWVSVAGGQSPSLCRYALTKADESLTPEVALRLTNPSAATAAESGKDGEPDDWLPQLNMTPIPSSVNPEQITSRCRELAGSTLTHRCMVEAGGTVLSAGDTGCIHYWQLGHSCGVLAPRPKPGVSDLREKGTHWTTETSSTLVMQTRTLSAPQPLLPPDTGPSGSSSAGRSSGSALYLPPSAYEGSGGRLMGSASYSRDGLVRL